MAGATSAPTASRAIMRIRLIRFMEVTSPFRFSEVFDDFREIYFYRQLRNRQGVSARPIVSFTEVSLGRAMIRRLSGVRFDRLNKLAFKHPRAIYVPLALIPFAYLVGMVAHYQVDVPFSDDWDLVPLLAKLDDHTLAF